MRRRVIVVMSVATAMLFVCSGCSKKDTGVVVETQPAMTKQVETQQAETQQVEMAEMDTLQESDDPVLDGNQEEWKAEYTPEILEYLSEKYGADKQFEVHSVTIEDESLYGDGYAMGLDKEPVAIDTRIKLTAEVTRLDDQVNFIVNGYKGMFGDNSPEFEYRDTLDVGATENE